MSGGKRENPFAPHAAARFKIAKKERTSRKPAPFCMPSSFAGRRSNGFAQRQKTHFKVQRPQAREPCWGKKAPLQAPRPPAKAAHRNFTGQLFLPRGRNKAACNRSQMGFSPAAQGKSPSVLCRYFGKNQKLYAPWVFILPPMLYNKSRKEGGSEWTKSESANLSPRQERQGTLRKGSSPTPFLSATKPFPSGSAEFPIVKDTALRHDNTTLIHYCLFKNGNAPLF